MASDPDPSSPAVPDLHPASGPPDQALEPPTMLPTPPASPASSSAVPQLPSQVASIQDTIHASLDPTFQYIVDDIIRLPQTSVIHHQDEVFEILDLVTMSPSDISYITGRINGEEVKISKRDARLLLHFVWWHQDISSRRLDTTLVMNGSIMTVMTSPSFAVKGSQHWQQVGQQQHPESPTHLCQVMLQQTQYFSSRRASRWRSLSTLTSRGHLRDGSLSSTS